MADMVVGQAGHGRGQRALLVVAALLAILGTGAVLASPALAAARLRPLAGTGRAEVLGATAVTGTGVLNDARRRAGWEFQYGCEAYGMTFSATSAVERVSPSGRPRRMSARLPGIVGDATCRYRLVVRTLTITASGRWVRFATPGGRATPPTPAGPGTAAENQAIAASDASGRLAQLVLPADATRLAGEPEGDGGTLAHPADMPADPDLVDQPGWWRVAETPSEVVSFVEAHRPAGAAQGGSGSSSGPGQPRVLDTSFYWPPVSGTGTRLLTVEVEALPDGTTAIRADAIVVWLVPRPLGEVVPAGVRQIDITRAPFAGSQPLSLQVTQPAQVAAITSAIDSLPTVQPGPVFCPGFHADTAPTITFAFETSAGGIVVASASEPSDVHEPTTACDPLSFSIAPQTPLLEGASFLDFVQGLLAFPLTTPPTPSPPAAR